MKTLFTLLCTFIIFYIAFNDEYEIKAQKQTIDSLHTELFKAQTDLGRYEITLELLSQEDTVAAAKFDRIYNNETE